MVSRYSLALRDVLAKNGVELLDIYRYQTEAKDKSGVIVKDVIRVKHKETGKIYLIDLGAAKETMEINDIIARIQEEIAKTSGEG